MTQTTYLLPFDLGTYSNSDQCWLTGLGMESVTTDPQTPNNNHATYIYTVERRLAADPTFVSVVTGTCTALIDPATTPGDPIQAVRDSETVTTVINQLNNNV
jgi:hypothetical protein